MAAKSWYIFVAPADIAFFGQDAGVGVGETQGCSCRCHMRTCSRSASAEFPSSPAISPA